jgi:hypothetical protein
MRQLKMDFMSAITSMEVRFMLEEEATIALFLFCSQTSLPC